MILRTALVAAGLLAAAGAQAAPPAQSDPPQEERKVCRTEKATGSLTRRTRICLTPTEWRELHDRTRRGLNEMTSAAAGGKQCVQDSGGGCR